MFSVARPYLNILVKPLIISDFIEKKNNCILKGKMPFKMHESIIVFFQKKKSKNMYVYPTLNFGSVNRNTLIFYLACSDSLNEINQVFLSQGPYFYCESQALIWTEDGSLFTRKCCLCFEIRPDD